jgi:hypothetical protein
MRGKEDVMKRRWWITLGLAVTVTIASIVALAPFRDDRVTQEALDEVKGGMPEPEVISILGEPDVSIYCESRHNARYGASWRKTWRGRSMIISVPSIGLVM